MIGKAFVIISFLAAVVSASIISSTRNSTNQLDRSSKQSHDFIIGAREYGDRQVHEEYIQQPSSWLQIVTFEQTFTTHGNKITQVQAFDQKDNGKGAFVSVLSGGPGSTYITLRFKSQRNHGIHFRVVIFAK